MENRESDGPDDEPPWWVRFWGVVVEVSVVGAFGLDFGRFLDEEADANWATIVTQSTSAAVRAVWSLIS
ncbi:hypothetical protein ABTW96_08660 [Nocardia beijingensis]|uniref:hypothetical protein n=1 Tax=Nocardia beijingensis TaxID=95162 RepID=UPI0033349FC2